MLDVNNIEHVIGQLLESFPNLEQLTIAGLDDRLDEILEENPTLTIEGILGSIRDQLGVTLIAE